MKKYFIVVLCGLLTIASCRKDEKPPEVIKNALTIKLSTVVDGLQLSPDTIIYKNTAGNLYGISRLEYYISDFTLSNNTGDVYKSDIVKYVNGFDATTLDLDIFNIKAANYSSIEFNIGLDSSINISNSLPLNSQNVNMAWPDMMGGGYHFLKLEGKYLNDSNEKYGFAMHLGSNNYHTRVKLNGSINLSEQNQILNLRMDVNKWFAAPNLYNFNIQGPYSMGIDSLMTKIKENGQYVFTIQP